VDSNALRPLCAISPQVACSRAAAEAWQAVEEWRRAAAAEAEAAASAAAAQAALPKSKRRRAPQPWVDQGTEVRCCYHARACAYASCALWVRSQRHSAMQSRGGCCMHVQL
jgi:hypothetical protein